MRKSIFIVVALMAAALGAEAQIGPIEVHGFGGSSYRKTDENLYIGGNPQGSYNQTELSVAVSSQVSDNLRISTQGLLTEDPDGGGVHTMLTYAFVEYSVTNSLKLRAGQIKLPFGNYGEIVHVGTLRPFLSAPQSVYGQLGVGVGPQDVMTGVGITGRRDLTPNLELAYDAYGGGMQMVEYLPPEAFLLGEPVSSSDSLEHESTHDVIGGRLALRLPNRGFEAGVSGYRGQEVFAGSSTRPRWVASIHTQFDNGPMLLRAELAHETVKEDLKVNGGYVEAAYKLTEHWQVAAQYAGVTTKIWGVNDPIAPSLLDHREKIIGLNYWFSPNVVIKSSWHHIHGNRLAGPNPDDYQALVQSGTLKPTTRLLMVGVDFSF